MTDSIPLQFKESLKLLLAAIPGVAACYLDRFQPVGENEAKPVLIIKEFESDVTDSDGLGVTQHAISLVVEIYVDTKISQDQISRATDPWWKAIHAIMYGSARSIPGVNGIRFGIQNPSASRVPNPGGEMGRVDLYYTIFISTRSHDLTVIV
jgi:hypothetical protein